MLKEAAGDYRVVVDDIGGYVSTMRKQMDKLGWPGMKALLFVFDGNTSSEYLPHNYMDHNTFYI